jgi:hypothetical protein
MRHLTCAVLWLCANSVLAGEGVGFRAGDLELRLDAEGRVAGLAAAGQTLAVRPLPLLTLYEVERKTWHEPQFTGEKTPGELRFNFPTARVDARLTIATRDDALRLNCKLLGAAGPARGFLLRMTLPFDARGWQWHRDMQTAVAIEPNRPYDNVVSLRAWADLPEFKDQPGLRLGYCNRNFCTVVSGPVGLCLAVPIDRPCIFRTTYDTRRGLELIYDFALAPETRQPNQVQFACDLYACDPRWGMRAGLAKYYELYPQLFKNYVHEPGQWMAFSRLSEIDNANEFYFGLQEGASEPEYDDRLGVLSTTYFTHAGQGANIPNYDPEKDPLPPYEVQLQAMRAAFARGTGVADLYDQVGLFTAEGRFDIRPWKAYAHLIAQFNLDPHLAYGRRTLERAVATLDEIQAKRHARLDGYYYDGLSSGINYRPDHFRTADAPCLWDPVAKRPLLNNFYSSCQFARAAAELMRPRGRITMMNGAMGASFYVAPWLDVLGAETGLRISRENLNYIRSITYRKPFLTLLKGNYEQKLGRPEIELYMKRCLAFGVFPGFFDWPTSGLGPGSGYWKHPRYFERDRDLFRKYQPLCRALARAGWEPIPHVTSSNPAVVLERFGRGPDGLVWLTVMNDQARPQHTTLTLDARALGLPADAAPIECILGMPLHLQPAGDKWTVELDLPADEVRLLALGSPRQWAVWRIGEAIDVLDRGVAMRKLDAGRPARAVHWLPGRMGYERERSADALHLVFRSTPAAVDASQWVMLFQKQPGPLALRVRAKADQLTRAPTIACRLAWVTPSFSHYQTQNFSLDRGTYDWREFQFKIDAPEALRAIHLKISLGSGTKGTLRLAEVSLVDGEGKQYVADPEFRAWYEPLPELAQIEAQILSLRAALVQLQASGRPTDAGHVRTICATLAQAMRQQDRDGSLRRVLRDLETVDRWLR